MRRSLLDLTDKLGLVDLYGGIHRWITGGSVSIINYHRVGDDSDIFLDKLDTKTFERQLHYIEERFEIIPLSELAQLLKVGSQGSNYAAITFDDGYKDNYTQALPILRKHGIKAAFLPITDVLDRESMLWVDEVRYMIHHSDEKEIWWGEKQFSLVSPVEKDKTVNRIVSSLKSSDTGDGINELRESCGCEAPHDLIESLYMSWDEVKEISEEGHLIGSHTLSHPDLTKPSLKEARREVVESKKRLEKELEVEVDMFAYPFGASNEETERLIESSGYRCGLGTELGLVRKNPEIFNLRRVPARKNFQVFKAYMNGYS
ncbi:MAG: polysaccharide deacetylase family protein [Deltaproteobacteria bacterium]|nr:polysaccharide deacetylase family protein [Deltaproteobacteria bacterium]